MALVFGINRDHVERRQRPTGNGGSKSLHSAVADIVVVEVQRLRIGVYRTSNTTSEPGEVRVLRLRAWEQGSGERAHL